MAPMRSIRPFSLRCFPGSRPRSNWLVLQPRTNEYGFLLTKLVRQRNRIHDALLQACELAEGLAASS